MRNQVLGDRYRILDRIGEGGMAYVYLAVDEKLGRKVAIKVLHEHMERNPDIRRRFQLEALAISTLEHPNIVKIYDFAGEGAERLWIVTEVIRGKNLAQYLQQVTGGWLHPVIAACIVREVCKALEKAHGHHIVHRDIKPENVMLTATGRVKLMDFGIAKDLAKAGMTVTGTFMGSPSYMSPEQIRGRDVDLRSDLYSLSVLFYEIVTGRLPFTGQTTHDVIMKIMEGGFTHPRYVVPSLPETLNAMIVKGMAKDPRARFQTARDYGETIDDLLRSMAFDESHVELERYARDRQGYEARLAKTKPGLYAGSGTLAQKFRRDTQATVSLKPSEAGSNRGRLRTTQGRSTRADAPGTSARPFQANATWQQHVPRAGAGQEPARTLRPPPPPPRPRPPAADPTRARHRTPTPEAARPRHRTPAPTPPLPRAPVADSVMRTRQATQMLAPPQAGVAEHVPAAPRRHAAVPMRPAPRFRMRMPRVLPRHTVTRRSWANQVFGASLVGLIAVLSIWGFWALESRLPSVPSHQSGAATAAHGHQQRPKHAKRNGTPPTQRTLTHKPPRDDLAASSPTPQPVRKPAPVKSGNTPAATAAKRPAKRPAPKPELVTMQTETPVSPGLTIKSAELRLAKHAVATAADTGDDSAAQPDDKPTPPVADKTPAPKPKPAPDVESGSEPLDKPQTDAPPKKDPPPGSKGRVSVSSQPAAEVLIDGRHLGTTVDNISDSGWLAVAAGKHGLELRRQGYTSYRSRFEVGPGEQKALGRIVLDQPSPGASATGAAGAALTLRVNVAPAQVTIRNLDNNTTQAFTMKTLTKVVPLPAGRYQVKIEYGGETKERELSLSGAQGQLTFTADFKEDE